MSITKHGTTENNDNTIISPQSQQWRQPADAGSDWNDILCLAKRV